MADRQKQQEWLAENKLAPQQEDGEMGIDVVELFYHLLGSWKMILAVALIFALVVGMWTFLFVTPMYEATSSIYVLSRRDSAINMSDLQIGAALTEDYIKVFKMWEVHEAVISNLNLPYDYKEMEDMLSVTNESGTRMLDITITAPDPAAAAVISNEYAKVASQYIGEKMSTEQPNIISVALAPSNPVSPNKTLNVLLGFIFGALLAGVIVTVRMLVDDNYKTAEDISKYAGLVTLAVVPLEENDGKSTRKPDRARRS